MKLYKYKQVAFKEDVPTKTSDLQNDSGFINQLKTINGQSLSGTGDIQVGGTVDQTYSAVSTNAQSGVAVAQAIDAAIGNAIGGNY